MQGNNMRLFIGYSFTLTSDGSPGRCNERMAKAIKQDLLSSPAGDHCVGLQWEIFDALEDLNDHSFSASEQVPVKFVAGPPLFQPSDLRDTVKFVAMLRSPKLPAQAALGNRLRDALRLNSVSGPDAAMICAALNQFIEDRMAFEAFCGLADVLDLDRSVQRPELGPLGIEKRRIPDASKYPKGLRRFQAMRINRQIIETLISSDALAKGIYMNVKQVADHVLDAIDVSKIRDVRVYGHPEHRDWCKKKTLEAMQQRGWSGSSDQIDFGANDAWEAVDAWDPDSAQVWCRSAGNWKAYAAL
jgi:hypothetical protein